MAYLYYLNSEKQLPNKSDDSKHCHFSADQLEEVLIPLLKENEMELVAHKFRVFYDKYQEVVYSKQKALEEIGNLFTKSEK